jgi:arylsulfatase A-like enzyme/cytochrome c-type biogenesis protein CcmH/NrfG
MKWARGFLCCLVMTAPAYAQQHVSGRSSSTTHTHRDVFLVTIDTLRADHVHCYGYGAGETPTLDQLAGDGVRFTHAFTPSPITNASHTTILTGLLPSGHGVTNFGVALDGSHPTMASLLKNEGYQTAAFIGAVVLDSKTLAPGLDRGFDFYDHFAPAAKNSSRWGRVERRGKDVVARAEKWLDAHETGARFVWVHLYDPHDPYDPPPPYDGRFRDRLYDGEIAYADAALGDFVGYLKKHGWYDGALVIVVADHGEGLGEHNEETHGIFLYDSTTHVPLIVKLPGREKAGATVDAQVTTTDILPGILDELHLPPLARSDGESLIPYIEGRGGAGQTAFGETDYPLSFGWAPLRSVRDPGFKFIEAPHPEFYDLNGDPGELHSVYQPWNAEVQKLREKLAAERERYPRAAKSPATVGTATTQELQALGYLGPADVGSSSTVAEPSLLPDPKDKIGEQNLLHAAMLASDEGHTSDARGALEKVLAMNGDSVIALTQLGQLELNGKNYGTAATYLARAQKLRPDDANLALNYGEALSKAGDQREAEEAVQASLKLNPRQYAARFLLGSIYFETQQWNAAQDQLEAALLIQSTPEAHLELAEVLLAEQKFEEARQEAEAAIKIRGDSAEAYELLARAYTGLGKNESAQKAQSHAKALSAQKKKP